MGQDTRSAVPSNVPAQRITDDEFRRFRDFLYRRTGLHFADGKRYFVDKRLLERMEATGCPSFQAYFALLRADPGPEVQLLINRFTVNETYFFREEHQFRTLVAELLPALTAHRPGAPIRIWSMPCATGEESYSIAIWLLEHWREVDRHEVEIIGSDIDTRTLDAAEAGYYGARALMRLSPDLVARYFEPVAVPPGSEAIYRIIGDLRQSVRFTRVNLVDPVATAAYRGFDIVFCRNLLIYFDDASRRLAAEALYDSLLPGGFLCLGHSESMGRISPLFETCRFPEAVVYRKPGAGAHGRS